MTRTRPWRFALPLLIWCALSGAAVRAQEPAPATQPTTAPTERQALPAIALEVRGDVQHAPFGSSDWKPCQVGDEYPQETVIRTGIRSAIQLRLGEEEPHTAILIESASRTIISEAFKTPDTKRVRLGVGYGRVRAGVAEGGLKSEFTIDSPVATLSKRGTWNFGLFYERGTDRFEIFLLDRGLVEALSVPTGERRQVLPREAVTEAMRRWLDEAQIRRNVPIPDLLGQSDIEIVFNRLRLDGLGVLEPGGGRGAVLDLSNDLAQQEFARLLQSQGPLALLALGVTAGFVAGPPVPSPTHAEGFFGTGRGDELIPLIIKATDPLAEKGFARPGVYRFRRAALEGWLRTYRGK